MQYKRRHHNIKVEVFYQRKWHNIHPKHFSCSEYSKQFKVVLQNTRIQTRGPNTGGEGEYFGYIVMLRARMFRSLIIRTGIKERNIRARNITI